MYPLTVVLALLKSSRARFACGDFLEVVGALAHDFLGLAEVCLLHTECRCFWVAKIMQESRAIARTVSGTFMA